MIRSLGFRTLFFLGALGCAAGLAFALYLQHGRGFEPCAMCISQRVALLASGLMLLLGALHGPLRGGRWAYALLTCATAGTGAFIAARQVMLQHLPPDQAPACGPTMGYVWDLLPKTEALQKIAEMIFKGDGNCAKIDAQWLGVTLPEWTLGAFLVLILYVLFAAWSTRSRHDYL